MNNRGKIIILVAPSGAGKSTLVKMLREDFPHITWSVSYTTRPKRKQEVHGQHYFFVSEEEFLEMENSGKFVESFEIHGNRYGTSKDFIEATMSAGEHILLDLDFQGADKIKQIFPSGVVSIFIAPPDLEVLKKRLVDRRTEDSSSIDLRIKNAVDEMKHKDKYDHLIVNDKIERAYKELNNIVREHIK